MVARVAIDLALDRLWQYAVPEEMEKKLAVGQLLLVPFGRRTARAFLMSLGDGCDGEIPHGRLKSIVSIEDPVPFFSPAVLDVVRRIAQYTASPIESVLRCAVPAAVLRPGARERSALYVSPVASSCKPPADSLTPRQQWLCDQIERLGGGWLAPLSRELGTTPGTLKALAAKGCATIETVVRRRDPVPRGRILPSAPLPLNPSQAAALEAISRLGSNGAPHTLLLHGVTGSGKTEVYLQAIAAELDAGRGAIVLVPEIALTPQTVQRFVSRFGNRIALLHSALSDGERYDEWHRLRSGEAKVAIGPRSAVFAPVSNLGLIVVDEEHDTSYKQDEMPRYNARDVAVLRGAVEGAKVVLGSATPSLESWMNAQKGRYAIATMSSRAGAGTVPNVLLVDMSAPENRSRIYSRELIDAIYGRLERSEQTILFLNRRGWARSVTCRNCGETIACPGCGVAYTYHKVDSCCRCHICGGWIPAPSTCPKCGEKALDFRGIGTQRAEEALKACFPHARVLRMDADSTSRRRSHDDILGAFRRHEADILVGTQMIAKGLDFPNVTLVGVLNADSALRMPDFRAAERAYQLVSQVAGRAGRAGLPGEAIVQTYDPSSPVLRAAAAGDYRAFADMELAERKAAMFPPWCRLCTVNLRSKDPALVSSWAEMAARSLSGVKGLKAGEAVPCALEMADGWHRWQIVLKSASAGTAVRAWNWFRARRPPPKELKMHIDVDAVNMM